MIASEEFEINIDLQDKFAIANPNPVLSSFADGVIKFINPAASILIQELELSHISSLLPDDHKGLVKACQRTRVTLTSDCIIQGRNITWSYQSMDESDVVYIYGYDVLKYQSNNTSVEILPKVNPNPVILSTIDGVLEFVNPAATSLLQNLQLEEITDILPVNHTCLLRASANSKIVLIEEKKIKDRTIVWVYKSPESNGAVCIYGYDISNFKSKLFSVEGIPRASLSPVLSADNEGMPKYINYAISNILDELGLDTVEDILPLRHTSLVRACLATNTPLIEDHKTSNRSLIWTYHPVEGSDFIYICGQDQYGVN